MLKAENRTGYAYDKIQLQIDVSQMLYSEIQFIQGDSILHFEQSHNQKRSKWRIESPWIK